jgi:hypothetical protein
MALVKLSPEELQSLQGVKPLDPSTGVARGAADVGLNLLKGTLMGGKMLSDAVSAGNPVSDVIDAGIGGLDNLRSQGAKDQDTINAARMQNAEQKGMLAEAGAAIKNFSEAPIDTIAQGAGTILPALFAQRFAKSPGAKNAVATGVGAGMGAGAVKGEIYEAVKKEHLDAGKSEEEAERLATEAQAYTGQNADQIALGAGLGAVAGGTGVEAIAARMGSKQVAEDGAGLLRKTLMGGVKEAVPEAIQGGQERFAVNSALARDGFDVDPMQGVVGNAVLEGLAASPLGAGAGAIEHRADSRAKLAATLMQSQGGAITDAAMTAVGSGAADTAAMELNTPMDLSARIDALREQVESSDFLMSLRKDERFGEESVQELLHAYNIARNPEMSPSIRASAVSGAEGLLSTFTTRPDFILKKPEEETFIRTKQEQAQGGTGLKPIDTQGGAVDMPGRVIEGEVVREQIGQRPQLPRQMIESRENADGATTDRGTSGMAAGAGEAGPVDRSGGARNRDGGIDQSAGSEGALASAGQAGTVDSADTGSDAVTPSRMVDVDAHEAATSPINDLPEPTDAQKEAGNYKKGAIKVGGLNVSVENPEGSVRRSKADAVDKWETTMTAHYGYIKGVKARAPDKEHVDVYVKPGTAEDYSGDVYVVNQIDPKTGKFDEPKVMIGYGSREEAEAGYRSNYTPDWKGMGSIAAVPMSRFKEMLQDEKAFLGPVGERLSTAGRSKMRERVLHGPASITTKPIGKTVYRETNSDGLDDLIRETFTGGAVRQLFVSDNVDLAIGQGDNKGVMIQMRGDAVSGMEHRKPGTGDISGREYRTDYIGPDAIDQIIVDGQAKLRGITRRFLGQYFEKKELGDGRVLYTRKGFDVGLPLNDALPGTQGTVKALKSGKVTPKEFAKFKDMADKFDASAKESKPDQEQESAQADSSLFKVIARVGQTPKNARPVTIRDGIIHIGDEPAYDYENGDPVEANGTSFEDVKKRLIESGAISSKEKVYIPAVGSKAPAEPAASVSTAPEHQTVGNNQATPADQATRAESQQDLFGDNTSGVQRKPAEEKQAKATEGAQPGKSAPESPKEEAEQAIQPKQTAESVSPLDIHDRLFERIYEGKASADEFHKAYDSLLKNKDAIIAELSSMTKAQLFERYPGLQWRYKYDKKDEVVNAAFRRMQDDFSLNNSISYSFGDKYDDVIRRIVERTDDAALEAFAEEVKAEAAKRKAERAERRAGMENPQTLDDFNNLLRSKMDEGMSLAEARKTLTPEQRERYDDMAAMKTRGERAARKIAQKTEVQAAVRTTSGDIIETKHTKTGEDLFVVKAAERVEREVYNQWNATAKRLGGWYSSYRGNGAVPGFQFKTRESAEAFLKYLGGEVDEAKEALQARRNAFEDDRSQTAAQRLTEMAEKLEGRANESLSSERKVNTARRARIAASAEAAANADKALAKTMRNIAEGIESGNIKYLDQVRQKVQVEMLQGMVRTAHDDMLREKYPAYSDQEKHRGEPPTKEVADYVNFPSYTAFRSDLANLGRALLEQEGMKKIGQRIMSVADDVTDAYLKFARENLLQVSRFTVKDSGGPPIFSSKQEAESAIARSGFKGRAIVLPFKRGENIIILSPSEAMKLGIWQGDPDKRITLAADLGAEIVEKLGKINRNRNVISVPWQFENAYDKRKRLSAMGIETPAELRAAIREFVSLHETPKAPDRVKELERAMIGRRNDGLDFFPTPASIADQMIETADIQEGMSVLEPSAGMGHIADRIREAGVEPDVVELSGERRELLEAKGYNLVGYDFMDLNEGEYDRIIMNPPFGDRRDSAHVQHAYELLKPGGRLVAIMGEGVFFGQDKRAQEFREWLERVGGTDEKLEEGTFNDPSLPVTTGVNARMVVIDKAKDAPAFSRGGAGPERVLFKPPAAWSRGAGRGMSPELVQMVVDRLKAKWKNAPEIIVVNDMNDQRIRKAVRDENERQLSQGATGQPEGFFDAGKVYIVASEMRNARDIVRVVMHETLGHYGLRGAFGKELESILKQMTVMRRADVLKKAAQYGLDPSDKRDMLIAAEEVLAEMAQNNPQLGFVQRAIAAIRSWLRKMGFDIKMTDAEIIREFIEPARAFVQRGNQKRDVADLVAAFDRGEADQTETEAFKRWFGDSKVVDADGKPLVLYHGTGRDFSVFRRSGGAIFLTPDVDFAASFAESSATENDISDDGFEYAGANVMPVYVAAKNPFDYENTEHVEAVFDHVDRYQKGAATKEDIAAGDFGTIESYAVQSAIAKLGFDAFYVEEGGVKNLGVYSPRQIKSAIGNNGNFDPENPNILFSRSATMDYFMGQAGSILDTLGLGSKAKKMDGYISQFEQENRRLREEHIGLWDKAKTWLKRQLAPGGLLPESVFAEKVSRDNEFQAIEFDVAHMVGQLEKAIREDYGISAGDLDEKVQSLLGDVLAGNVSQRVPEATRTALLGMRQYIDGLSKQYLDALAGQINMMMATAEATDDDALRAQVVAKIDLYETIMGNLGEYVHRSYRAFDDADWPRKVPDTVIDNARMYLMERFAEQGVEDTRARAEVVLNEILKHGTAYESMDAFIRESKLGAKDLSVLKRRKEIAPEIRALLGEYTDPRVNFAKSATKMGRLIWNQRFLERIRDIGMGEFLFTDATKPPEATSKIAAEGSEVMAPLNGLWVTPEVNQAFVDALGKERMEDWYRKIVQINGLVKYGKAQPLDAEIKTPRGPIRMGDVEVGMVVCGLDGPATVTGVFPQGEMNVYRITFSDGSFTEASDEHLWDVEILGSGKRTMTTAEILALPAYRIEKRQVAIPLGRAYFEASDVPIDPYFMGVLLGDGSFRGSVLRLSSPEKEIIERVRSVLPDGYSIKSPTSWADIDYAITAPNISEGRNHKIRNALNDMGIWGHSSLEKFIPRQYMINSAEVRMEVARGLLDTDGWVDRLGQPHFTTSSRRLADDFRELAESLGASVIWGEKKSASGNIAYDLSVRVENARDWFWLPSKAQKAKSRKKPAKRTIKSIEYVGKKQCQCIMVDDPRHLYLTDRFIVTHNTVLSPTTAARNWMSAFFFTVANGHFDMRHMAKAVDGLKEYFAHGGEPAKMAYLRKLKQLGVVYDTPYAGEMMRLLEDANIADTLTLGKRKLSVKKAFDLATKFYQYGDDFWKIVGFENEKRLWMASGMSEHDAEVKAAERIRNTYPTYSMVGKGIQSLRRFPLVGSFVSFPAEIIRTSINMVRYLAEDYQNPATRDIAIRRGIGLAITSSFAYAAQALTMAALGIDDDDDDAVRQMAAPWQRNSSLWYSGRDEQGNIRYMDLSFLDPYNYWKRPIMAVLRGQPAEDAVRDVFAEALAPFFGTDIGAGAIFEVLANRKSETGAPVYKPHDDVIDQIADIANHLRKELQPGIMNNLERTYKALDGETSVSGRKYDPADEAAAWFGFRMSTLDPKVALYYRSFDFKDAKAEAEKRLRDVIRDPGEVEHGELLEARADTIRLRARAYEDMGQLVRAAERSGMTRGEISQVLRSSGVSVTDTLALMTGRVPEWRANPATITDQVKKARTTFGEEGGARVMERYRMLNETPAN